MTEALTILTSITLILLLGVMATIISNKLKLSNVLLLLLLGMALKPLQFNGANLFEFSTTFLISISILALVMITFDGTSRLTLRVVEKFSTTAIKMVLWFIFSNIIILGAFTTVMFFPDFSFKHIIFSIIFAVIMAGTDPGAVFYMMKDKMTKVISVLEIESIVNTPIIVILPFILLDLLSGGNGKVVENFIEQFVPFLQQIIVGIGSGVLVGIIVFKAMKKVYHNALSPLGIITATLVAYITAENLGGNGILSVATMGLIFGNIYVKHKIYLQEFNSIFSNGLEIMVFVLVGFLIPINMTFSFFIKSIILFIVLLISRWVAVTSTLKHLDFNAKEKLFMALNMPKGIAVATVIFSLTIKNIAGLEVIIDLILLFILYSLAISTIIGRYSKKLIRIDVQEEAPA